MQYFSTRGSGPVTLDEALVRGIAPDGGLYLPETLPDFSIDDFAQAETIGQVADVLLAPFFAGSSLAGEVQAVLAETFGFPIPATNLPTSPGSASLLELCLLYTSDAADDN